MSKFSIFVFKNKVKSFLLLLGSYVYRYTLVSWKKVPSRIGIHYSIIKSRVFVTFDPACAWRK